MALKNIIRIPLVTLIGLTLLVGSAAIYFNLTIDQETIKKKAVQLVQDKTGRTLKIDGNVSLSFFPWLGVKIKNVSLNNPPNFKDKNFASAKEIGVSIKLLPLVIGNFEIGNISLKNLELDLIKNNSGISNWQDLVEINKNQSPSSDTKDSKISLEKFSIKSLTIDNGSILWQDQKTNKKIKATALDFSSKNIKFDSPFKIAASFQFDDLTSSFTGDVKLNTQIQLDYLNEIYKSKQLQLTGKLKNKAADSIFNFGVATAITIDLKKQTLNTDSFKLNIAGVDISGSLNGANISNQPNFSGSLNVISNDSQELLKLLGFNKAFTKTIKSNFKMDIGITDNVAKIKTIKANLDDMVIEGTAEYNANNLGFALALNKLNADIFAAKSADSKETGQTKQKTSSRDFKVATAPTSAKPITLNGNIKIGTINFANFKATSFATDISGNINSIDCQRMGFNFYEGKAHGSANINTHGTQAVVNLNMSIENASMQNLLTNLANFSHFKGTLALNTTMNLNSLTGNGQVNITKGSYQGIDIPFEVRRASAILNAKPIPPKTEPPHTDFNQLTMSFKMNNGNLNTNDLLVQADDYKVTGTGNVNILTKNLDLSLSAYSTHDENIFVPVKITGTLNKPSFKFDAAVMLKQAVKKLVNDVLQKEVGKHIPENLQQEISKILPLDKLFH
jgi:AsmA protein